VPPRWSGRHVRWVRAVEAMLGANEVPTLLQLPPVARGEVVRRVVRTRPFCCAIMATAIGCAAVHVLVGYLSYRCWGHCPFPGDGDRQACLVLPGEQEQGGISLVSEVLVDATLTAFFVSGGMISARVKEVRNGRLPLVLADAFPRGWLLSCMFPRCSKRGGVPATRHDHLHNVGSWLGITAAFGFGWGGMTLGVLGALWALPIGGPAQVSFCMSPWAFIALRAFWSDLEAIIVASGAYILWCTRGDVQVPKLHAGTREPLSPTADFVVVN
jgi:hypothetical protein